MQADSRKRAELLVASAVYVALVGAGVLMDAPDLAGFAALTIIPLALLLGLRRELSMKQKLASVGPLWYALPVVAFATWITIYPGRPIYFLVGAFCGLIFLVCFDFVISQYWGRRD